MPYAVDKLNKKKLWLKCALKPITEHYAVMGGDDVIPHTARNVMN